MYFADIPNISLHTKYVSNDTDVFIGRYLHHRSIGESIL
jgi:hypothetical protein